MLLTGSLAATGRNKKKASHLLSRCEALEDSLHSVDPFFNKLCSMNYINLSTESQFYGLVCLIATQLK